MSNDYKVTTEINLTVQLRFEITADTAEQAKLDAKQFILEKLDIPENHFKVDDINIDSMRIIVDDPNAPEE